MTTKELNLLSEIKNYTSQDESNHSGFLSTNALSRSNAGVISSLEKKGFIYNAYADMTKADFTDMMGVKTKPFKMWCVTPQGWESSEPYMNLVNEAIEGYKNSKFYN
jgi:hypothetical protein